MSQTLKKIGVILCTLLAATILGFGAHSVYASASMSLCDPAQPGYLGECPPYNPDSCNVDCAQQGSSGNFCGGGCCICAVR